jgi:hypothetical protein
MREDICPFVPCVRLVVVSGALNIRHRIPSAMPLPRSHIACR